MVYGVTIVLGVIGLWLLVNIMNIPFWIAQGGLVVVSVMGSFLGHRNFTFKGKNEPEKIN
jgi:putative flippase GtrA